MSKLSSDDKIIVDQFDKIWNAILETISKAQQFKVNDYLILKVSNHGGHMVTQTNSYGAPVKYQVVHLNDQGIAFVKRTNKAGEPSGRIYSCCGTEADDYRTLEQKFAFELDPDFADSILLDDDYDPASLHRSKKDIWKSVTEHNKASKIPTQESKDVVAFFHTVSVGDTLWTSNIGSYFVQDKKTMTPLDFNKNSKYSLHTRYKGPFVIVLTLRDKNGKLKDVCPDFFLGKALYRERPRTYKELNI